MHYHGSYAAGFPVAFQSSGVSVMAQKLAENLSNPYFRLTTTADDDAVTWLTTEPSDAYAKNNYTTTRLKAFTFDQQ